MDGLEGIDYLDKSAFIRGGTYVFGPVIKALKKHGGYTEGVDLEAAPYDWRVWIVISF